MKADVKLKELSVHSILEHTATDGKAKKSNFAI